MADLIIDLMALWAILLLAAVTLLGWGCMLERVLGISPQPQVETGTLWLGFVALLGALDLMHLLIRIDWMASLGCLLVGLAGCRMQDGASRKSLLTTLTLQMRSHPMIAASVAMFAIVWSVRSMGIPNNFDSGLYHFASIRWLNEQPLVPGEASGQVGSHMQWRVSVVRLDDGGEADRLE